MTVSDHPELDNSMKVHRARLGLTQADVARLVGVTRKTINTIENGVYVPSTVLALKIALVFGVSINEVFSLPTPPPPNA